MIKSFKFTRRINIGALDKTHQYEFEEFEVVSDESFAEAKSTMSEIIQERTEQWMRIANIKKNPTLNIPTKQ